MMKKIIFALLTLFMVPLFAVPPASLKWCSTFQEAQALAQKNKRLIFVYFSGSDWVSDCLRIEKEIFTQQRFIHFVNTNFVLYNADFPRRNPPDESIRRENERLIRICQIENFPMITILDSSGKPRGGITVYYGDAKSFINELSKYLK